MTSRNAADKTLQKTNGFKPAPDHPHIQRPEAKECNSKNIAVRHGRRPNHIHDCSTRLPANPRLNPEPPASRIAHKIAGMFVPRVPKLARTNTGNGMPYFAPACAFNIIGIRTIKLPSRIVPTACFQFIPPAISDGASVDVVTSIDMENQSVTGFVSGPGTRRKKWSGPAPRCRAGVGMKNLVGAVLCHRDTSTLSPLEKRDAHVENVFLFLDENIHIAHC